jgi:acyl-CoA synthetase (AMP-forming)/AMP-acid ligase II
VTTAPDLQRPTARTEPPVPLVARLAEHGDRVAVVSGGGTTTYAELANRVDEAARRLGATRRLVLLGMSTTLDALVAYLGALAGGHPVVLAPATDERAIAGLVHTYDPDVVVHPSSDASTYHHRRDGSAHDLHPDLALLLSTSGSTGSPKLVRLSGGNVQANAEAIADYLDIRPTDRAVTTLPLHYCYGLSVLHSHLLRGAAIVLTEVSVVDACFWDLVREQGVTSFAGVPHTFDLLQRVGFARMHLPDLRYVTQAGGRLPPDRVRDWARVGRRQGWDLVVMYGQTEATARMAYLPPHLAEARPEAIGVPVPGGSLRVEPVAEHDEPGVGELVYSGPNVMLGYAETPEDLGHGRTVQELRTGDLARLAPDGLYEVVGRRSRFLKLYGLRVDLGRLEERLAGEHRLTASCVGDDDGITVAVEGRPDPERVREAVAASCAVPARVVQVLPVDLLPRLANGKPDLRAVQALAAVPVTRDPGPTDPGPTDPGPTAPGPTDPGPTAPSPAGPVDAAALRHLYAELLDRPDTTDDDSFVDLGGDSLSYVEVSVRLEELLGHLPAGWHTLPVRELVPAARTGRRPGRTVETSVLLRAVAIVLVVGTHAKLFTVLGGAHVLVAVAGFNFARFQLTAEPRVERLRHQLVSVARVVAPSVTWIAGAFLITDLYTPANLLLLNAVVGPETWTTAWHFWFVEVLVLLLLLTSLVMATPWADGLERRFPFGFVALPLAVGLLSRYQVWEPGLGPLGLNTRPVLWLFALGWAAARASTVPQRVLVTAVAGASVPGFFDDPRRELLMVAGLALLVWAPGVRCPSVVARVAGVLASASLFVYLTHWVVYPWLDDRSPLLAVLAALGVGIGYWAVATRLMTSLTRRWSGGHVPARRPRVRARRPRPVVG